MITRAAAAAWKSRWHVVNAVTECEQLHGSPAERLRHLSVLYLSVPEEARQQTDEDVAVVRRRWQRLRQMLHASTRA